MEGFFEGLWEVLGFGEDQGWWKVPAWLTLFCFGGMAVGGVFDNTGNSPSATYAPSTTPAAAPQQQTPPPSFQPRIASPTDTERSCARAIADARAQYGRYWSDGMSVDDSIRCEREIDREKSIERERLQEAMLRRMPAVSPPPSADIPPQLIFRQQPTYPPRALERGVQGMVRVQFTIGADGNVKDAVVIWSDPPRLFDAAALNAVRRWRYRPRFLNGRPVDSERIEVEIAFEIKE